MFSFLRQLVHFLNSAPFSHYRAAISFSFPLSLLLLCSALFPSSSSSFLNLIFILWTPFILSNSFCILLNFISMFFHCLFLFWIYIYVSHIVFMLPFFVCFIRYFICQLSLFPLILLLCLLNIWFFLCKILLFVFYSVSYLTLFAMFTYIFPTLFLSLMFPFLNIIYKLYKNWIEEKGWWATMLN